jgi:TRAP-type C4-dicarboxylate transport system substrate-binding protein
MMPSRRATRHVAIGVASAAAIMMAAPTALAQDKTIELKISHWVPPAHPLHKMLDEWGSSVEKASNGTIKYKIYPSQQLGKAMDHYDMAKDGIADVTYVSPGYQAGRFPIIDAGNLPFMANNAKEGSAAVDEWYRKYAPTEMKDVKFCFAFLHDPGGFHSRTKKIMVPADIKGMKIRPAHATIATLVQQLGGTNVPGAAPEVRDLIEKGVADAVTFPWGSVVLFGVDKVTKYHMEAPLYVTSFVWIMNQAKYNQMSANQKKVIDDHCNSQWALRLASPWADFEYGGIAKIRAEPGHEVYTISAAQLNEWRQASEPVVKVWAEQVRKAGGDPDTALNELKQALTKHKSLTN